MDTMGSLIWLPTMELALMWLVSSSLSSSPVPMWRASSSLFPAWHLLTWLVGVACIILLVVVPSVNVAGHQCGVHPHPCSWCGVCQHGWLTWLASLFPASTWLVDMACVDVAGHQCSMHLCPHSWCGICQCGWLLWLTSSCPLIDVACIIIVPDVEGWN